MVHVDVSTRIGSYLALKPLPDCRGSILETAVSYFLSLFRVSWEAAGGSEVSPS